MKTISDYISELQTKIDELEKLNAIEEQMIAMVRNDWLEERSICLHCEGSGEIYHKGYMQFIKCESCGGIKQEVSIPEFNTSFREELFAIGDPTQDMIDRLKNMISSPKAWKGATAKVVKGRKVQIGTVIEIEFAGNGQYGPYVATSYNGSRTFINIDHVEMIPSHDLRKEIEEILKMELQKS